MTQTAATTTDQQAQDQIKALEGKIANDPALQAQMLANPFQTMINLGVPEKLVAPFLSPSPATATESKSSSSAPVQGVSIKTFWWGYQLTLSSQLCSALEGGMVVADGLAAAISIAQPELAPVAGLIAAGITVEGGVIQVANSAGNGVHFDLRMSEITLALPTLGVSLTPALIPIPN